MPLGTTCHAWGHQPKALRDRTVRTLAASPFTKVRMCLFPKHYVYNTNEEVDVLVDALAKAEDVFGL